MKKILYTFALLSISALAVVGASVHAQSNTDQDTVSQRCERTQRYIKSNIQPRDLRTRVDRLQAYQYIEQRLDLFVIRLEHNDQPYATEMRTKVDELSELIETFKTDYEAYDTARNEVTKLSSCKDKVDDFQAKLVTAREMRQLVHDDVVNLQEKITDTKTQLGTLYDKLLATDKSGSN